jgi:hypothetical protein
LTSLKMENSPEMAVAVDRLPAVRILYGGSPDLRIAEEHGAAKMLGRNSGTAVRRARRWRWSESDARGEMRGLEG